MYPSHPVTRPGPQQRPFNARWRIALADDHAIVRVGYRRLLEMEPDLQVVAEYGDADSAAQDLISRRATDPVDMLILDLSMPGRSGLDLLKQLREVLPDLHVLVVSMHDSMPMQSQCLRAGAAGFVSKSGDPESVVRAVRAVQSGLRTLHPNMHSQAQAAPHERLTARELEVVQFLIMGLGIDAIAVRLGVSEKTVSNYQTLVRHKLSVSNSVELVHYAQTHGLIP